MVSMAYKKKFEEFMNEQLEREAFMRRSREKADKARADYRERMSRHVTPVSRLASRTQGRYGVGRVLSGLNPDVKRPLKSAPSNVSTPLTRAASNSRARYARNTGDTSYEATRRGAVATRLMKRQDNELMGQYNAQAKKKREYEEQAKRDVARNAGYYDDERNQTEKIARYNATHGGPAKTRVKVYDGGGVKAVADTGKAAIAGGSIGASFGALAGADAGATAGRARGFIHGAREAAKTLTYKPGSKNAGKTIWNTYRNLRGGVRKTVHNSLRNAMAAGGKAGAIAGAKRGMIRGAITGSLRGLARGAGLAAAAYDTYRLGKWMVDQRTDPNNVRRDSEAAHQRDEYERKRKYLNNGWDGGAR